MIYLQIKQLIKTKSTQWGRKVTVIEVANATGISRMTLFRIMKCQGYCTVTDHIDKLCDFFECEVCDLVTYVPNTPAKQLAVAA